jgi:hypothetical protein
MYERTRTTGTPPSAPPTRQVTKEYVVYLKGIGASSGLIKFAERQVQKQSSGAPKPPRTP